MVYLDTYLQFAGVTQRDLLRLLVDLDRLCPATPFVDDVYILTLKQISVRAEADLGAGYITKSQYRYGYGQSPGKTISFTFPSVGCFGPDHKYYDLLQGSKLLGDMLIHVVFKNHASLHQVSTQVARFAYTKTT